MPRCLLWKRVPGYTIPMVPMHLPPMAPMNLVEQIRTANKAVLAWARGRSGGRTVVARDVAAPAGGRDEHWRKALDILPGPEAI
jgi:hypothetical protein